MKVAVRYIEGTYTDQFGKRHDAFIALEIQRLTSTHNTTKKSGYGSGNPIRIFHYEDIAERRYTQSLHPADMRSGGTFRPLDSNEHGKWKEFDRLTASYKDRPLMTPDEEPVPKLEDNEDYRFYETTQFSMLMES